MNRKVTRAERLISKNEFGSNVVDADGNGVLENRLTLTLDCGHQVLTQGLGTVPEGTEITCDICTRSVPPKPVRPE